MNSEKLTEWLNKELPPQEIEDSSCNGLQYPGSKTEMKCVGLAVDACLESFELAEENNCDYLIVHHGLFWRNHLPQRIDAQLKTRLDALSNAGISLYASHLPLDAHAKYGNNAELFRLLKLKQKKLFAEYHGKHIGFKGLLPKPMLLEDLGELVSEILETDVRILSCGREKVKSIGVCSGGGGFAARNVDCLITGEFNHSDFHNAVESNVNIIEAGHYNTETLGVKALGRGIEKKFKVKTVFLDAPTEL